MSAPVLSPRFADALVWVTRRHAGQVRHNTGTPYVSHLLATSAVVLEEGGGETLAVAALLHDVLEDQPVSRDEVRRTFGPTVYRIVDDCTDAALADRAAGSWRERKRRHLARMAAFADDSLLVIAADKLCSLQSLLDDLHRFGRAVFDDSARTPLELLWNYRQVLAVLAPRLGGRAVVHRLTRSVDDLAVDIG